MDFDVEDWDDEFGFTDDDSGSVVSSLPAAPNRIVGICAEKFVDSNPENKWDDDFAFDKSDGSGGLFGGNQILKVMFIIFIFLRNFTSFILIKILLLNFNRQEKIKRFVNFYLFIYLYFINSFFVISKG